MALDNALAMSDEDFMRAMESQEDQETTEIIEDTQVTEPEVIEPDTNQENDDSNEDTEVEYEEGNANEQSQEVEPDNTEVSDTDNSEATTEATGSETTEIDYKKFYETVTQDFKASGKVMPGVKEPEKFIKALQMATDYALKTAALKPALKRVKMLDGVSDEEFSEMLDFRKRNPEVIKKALKEAQLDPLDLDMDQINYVPQQRIPSDAEYEYKEVVEELARDTEFAYTRNIVLNELDEKSKEVILTQPKVLQALHQEVVSGRFEQIQAQALHLKTFGDYSHISDLDLYAMIAHEMDKQGIHANPVNSAKGVVNTQVTNTVQPKQSISQPNPELEDKRARAGIQPKTSTKVVKKYDPTKLSDEEFMKLLSEGAEFIDK